MTKRIFPDRPLTGAEKTARWKARNPEYNKAYRAANPEKWAVYAYRQKTKRRAEGRKRFVYMYVSPKGYTAYVGRGTLQRAVAHQKDRRSPWYESDMVLHTMSARDEWHAMELEGQWGQRFQPRYNVEGIRHLPNWQAAAKARRTVT